AGPAAGRCGVWGRAPVRAAPALFVLGAARTHASLRNPLALGKDEPDALRHHLTPPRTQPPHAPAPPRPSRTRRRGRRWRPLRTIAEMRAARLPQRRGEVGKTGQVGAG